MTSFPEPIDTLSLFPELDRKLLELLRSLTPEEWQAATIARLWTVKDIAAHLLDGNIRTISMMRDHYFGEQPGSISTHEELVAWLNLLNADWVKAMKRVSPEVLIHLLEITGPLYHACLMKLEPGAKALFAVDWAGEAASTNRFHIAREYTEKWHHQQQVRDAVSKPGIMTGTFYYPCLDTFMRALPYTYQVVSAPVDTILQFTITGEGGGNWFLVMKEKWELCYSVTGMPKAHTVIDGAIAWKLFSKSFRRKDVEAFVTIHGDQRLGTPVLNMVSVMA